LQAATPENQCAGKANHASARDGDMSGVRHDPIVVGPG
jgi:hypothetical protein